MICLLFQWLAAGLATAALLFALIGIASAIVYEMISGRRKKPHSPVAHRSVGVAETQHRRAA